MLQISNSRELEDWLESQPREISVAIAGRIALRTITLGWEEDWARDRKTRAALLMPLFCATAAPWVAGTCPTQGAEEIKEALSAAHSAALSAAARSAHSAARSALSAALSAAHSAADSADSAALSADSAALSADSAALSAARSAVWQQISRDCNFIEGETAGKGSYLAANLSRQPLWYQMPGALLAPWRKIEKILLDADEGWDVWTTWYQRRIAGGPWNEALEVERVISPSIPWSSGDPVKINKALAEIEVFHLALRARLPETVVFNDHTGLHSFVSDAPLDQSSLQDVTELVADRIRTIRSHNSGNDMFAQLEPLFERLLSAIENHRGKAQRIHDELYSAWKTVLNLLAAGDLATDHMHLTPFIDALANGCADIRTNDEKVDKTVTHRIKHRLRAANEEELLSVELKTEAAIAASDDEGGMELRDDLDVLRALRDDGSHPSNPVPEVSAHRVASRLPRIKEEKSLKVLRDNVVDNADRIAKIDDGAKAGFRWLTYLVDIFG